MKINKNICKRCHNEYVGNWVWGEEDDEIWEENKTIWCPARYGKCPYELEHLYSYI